MKNDYKDKDPEKMIFGAALGSLKIEPSQKFWNSALHGIIDKEGAKNKARLRTWKGISFGLGTVIVLMGLHEAFMYSKLNNVDTELTEIKNNQVKLQQQIANNTAITQSNNSLANNQQTSAAANPSVEGNTQSVAANANEPIAATHAQNQNSSATYATLVHHSKAYTNPPYPQVAPLPPIESDVQSGTKAQPGNEQQGGSTPVPNNSGRDNGNSSPPVASQPNEPIPQQNASVPPAVTKQKNDSAAMASRAADSALLAKQEVIDSLNAVIQKNAVPKNSFNLHNRISISGFFAPGGLSDFLKDHDNDNDDNITAKTLKARQSDWFAYEAGMKLGFNVSGRFRIQTGLYYNAYSYNIGENVITAQQRSDGSVGYSMVTSSGVTNIPYTGPVKIGDSIKVHGSSSRGYVCIPLQLSYTFISHNKLGLYVIGGAAANIAATSGTEISWQNTMLQSGNVSVSSIEGLSKVHYSYSLGVGAEYRLGRGVSVYAEPFMQGSVTAINNNTPVSTYPFFFGAAAGITYMFK